MDSVAYQGEVWTDGSGFATVRLPDGIGLEPPLEYDLRDLDPPGNARVISELENGRFTLATDQPHAKVAWRITGRCSANPSGSNHRTPPHGRRRF